MTMGRKYCAIDAAIALSLPLSLPLSLSSFVAERTEGEGKPPLDRSLFASVETDRGMGTSLRDTTTINIPWLRGQIEILGHIFEGCLPIANETMEIFIVHFIHRPMNRRKVHRSFLCVN